MAVLMKSANLLVIGALVFGIDPATAATKIGVTSAVNPKAVGTVPGGATRTLVIGKNVVFNHRIKTSRGGLVQLLFVDGSAFTVGENSELIIDRFIYDPNRKTGKMVANVVKGVFRFVGGRLSKSQGGVTINTPGVTIGIRGGVMAGKIGSRGQKSTFSLLFGDLMSVSTRCFSGTVASCSNIRRVYQNGNSVDVSTGGTLDLRPTTLQDMIAINRSLGGTPGRKGGARKSPTNKSVAKSNIGNSNSGNSPDQNAPPAENAIRATKLPDVESDLVHLDVVTGDDARYRFENMDTNINTTTTTFPTTQLP